MKRKTKKLVRKGGKTRKKPAKTSKMLAGIRRAKKSPKKKVRILKSKKTRQKVARRPIRRARQNAKLLSRRPKNIVGKGTLEQLFESLAKVKLMKFFFRNSIDTFQVREILKMVRTNKSAVKQEIKKLEKIGLIESRKKQGRIVYSLNNNFDFLEELKNLILKSTISSKSELINNVRKIGNIKLLVLGGIFRNNEADEADILIVGDKINARKLTTFTKDLEAEVGKELNCATMSAKEFNYRYDMYDRFVRDLINENKDVLINKLNLW